MNGILPAEGGKTREVDLVFHPLPDQTMPANYACELDRVSNDPPEEFAEGNRFLQKKPTNPNSGQQPKGR